MDIIAGRRDNVVASLPTTCFELETAFNDWTIGRPWSKFSDLLQGGKDKNLFLIDAPNISVCLCYYAIQLCFTQVTMHLDSSRTPYIKISPNFLPLECIELVK